MVVSALLLVGTVYLFQIVPKGFIPSVDTGQINGGVEFAQGVGYETTVVARCGRYGDPAERSRTCGVHRGLGRRAA